MSYDPKTYGYRESNFKGIFETDPDGFEERKKKIMPLRKKWALRQDPAVTVLFVVN